MDSNFFDRTTLEWIALAIFFGAVAIELFFLLFFYLRLLLIKQPSLPSAERSVSVCLAVRNEEERIEAVLTQLLEQDYSNFEVIVVDDFSGDCTIQKVAQLSKKYPQLKFTSISQETNFSEKLSINLAMKASKSDRVLFLRPDSLIDDRDFLKKENELAGDSSLLINYTNLEYQRNVRNKLCRMERFTAFLNSAAYSLAGLPVVYQDSNVLFVPSLYFDQSGFKGKMNDHFANLELVLNAVVKKKIRVSLDAKTIVRERSVAERGDFSALLKKKICLNRQLNLGQRFVYGLTDVSKLLFVGVGGWLLVIEAQNWLFYAIPALFVLFLQLFIVKTMAARLKEDKIFLSSFVYVYIRPVLNLLHSFKIYIHDKRNKWN
ncbi:glycosyltransferase [Sunxiuqinia sp. sy24]|uniref:glycosyltransferase n=1 Tax=Sunxiuqinia sp. sy24 TaxID=3461495 RepID=UPI004045D1B5